MRCSNQVAGSGRKTSRKKLKARPLFGEQIKDKSEDKGDCSRADKQLLYLLNTQAGKTEHKLCTGQRQQPWSPTPWPDWTCKQNYSTMWILPGSAYRWDNDTQVPSHAAMAVLSISLLYLTLKRESTFLRMDGVTPG